MKGFEVVTICGSMRYFDRMIEVANTLSAEGKIVLMPFVAVIKPEDQENNPLKKMLDRMHFAKIDMSSAIVVVGDYTGFSTNREIEYAESTGKEIWRISLS